MVRVHTNQGEKLQIHVRVIEIALGVHHEARVVLGPNFYRKPFCIFACYANILSRRSGMYSSLLHSYTLWMIQWLQHRYRKNENKLLRIYAFWCNNTRKIYFNGKLKEIPLFDIDNQKQSSDVTWRIEKIAILVHMSSVNWRLYHL